MILCTTFLFKEKFNFRYFKGTEIALTERPKITFSPNDMSQNSIGLGHATPGISIFFFCFFFEMINVLQYIFGSENVLFELLLKTGSRGLNYFQTGVSRTVSFLN